ncbi:MAG: hypothetical protein V3U57_03750 [Robiginitomaculum sp.]
MIETGTYQSGIFDTVPVLDDIVEVLHVDAKKYSVSLVVNGKTVQTYSARPLARKEWRKGCSPKHTSIDKRETWILADDDETNHEHPPVFLYAICNEEREEHRIMLGTVLFQRINE